jgi:UDP-N-acetylglucosamine--N-acetylmuramyl-(pentapeptide) pyrophosphoryl-undecaprenol N-acetylglucosamine transferase
MKLMFAGGKTGGHIFPAIAMALEFKRRHSEGRLVFVGARGGMEEKIVPRYGFRLSLIRTRGLSRRFCLSNLLLAYHLLTGFCQARSILNQEKPDLVVGTGGHVSFPAVMLACLKNVPTMIQEQNSYPGISTRILARFVDKVCLSYSESLRYFPAGKKLRVIGNPVRADLVGRGKTAALKGFGLEEGRKTIFVFGGSQGSHALNQALVQSLELLKPDWQILWQTGERDFPQISRKVEEKKIGAAVHAFIRDMGSAYAASDLVISRAGALTLAEITACGKPSILIPFPFAAADHQRHNAEALQRKGAARMILEKDLTPEKLADEVGSLLSDEESLRRMAEASAQMGKPQAASMLVDEMEKLLAASRRNTGARPAEPRRPEV